MNLMENYWYIILESGELSKKPLKVKRLGENIVLWRDSNGSVQAIDDRCSHRGASLALGEVHDDCITCPFHGIEFDGQGDCKKIPFVDEDSVKEKLKTKSYRVTEKFGFVWLWHGEDYQGEDPVIFEDIKKDYAYHTMRKEWATHFTRAIENQLDYYHLPFVHKNTIGRGFKPITSSEMHEKLKVDFDGETISAKMKTGNISGDTSFRFMFPNSWQLRFSNFAFLYVAFCPIDSENTLLYLRSYIKGQSFKGLKNLVLKPSPMMNKKILDEDEEVVLSQMPKEITPDMDENLLALDKPIALFRKQYFSRLSA